MLITPSAQLNAALDAGNAIGLLQTCQYNTCCWCSDTNFTSQLNETWKRCSEADGNRMSLCCPPSSSEGLKRYLLWLKPTTSFSRGISILSIGVQCTGSANGRHQHHILTQLYCIKQLDTTASNEQHD